MGLEIERKFLVNGEDYLTHYVYMNKIQQGYLNLDIYKTVRVRIDSKAGYLTVKGKNEGSVRKEFEYEIPIMDAVEMLGMCEGIIDKERYVVTHSDFSVEVDVFDGDNKGLVVAEVEFNEDDPRRNLSEGELQHHLPEWIGEEVTNDGRYYNSSLLQNPYKNWKENA